MLKIMVKDGDSHYPIAIGSIVKEKTAISVIALRQLSKKYKVKMDDLIVAVEQVEE